MSATNRGARRANSDQYMTPDYAVMSLIKSEGGRWDGTEILDPCCGDGEILRRLEQNIKCDLKGIEIDTVIAEMARINVPSAKIVTANYFEIDKDNSLYDDLFFSVSVTNPPFSHWMQCVEKMIETSHESWALLRLNVFGAQYRKNFWNKENRIPSDLIILSKRPRFRKPAAEYWLPENFCLIGKGTDATEYAWFGWAKHRAHNATRIQVV